jgi:hypothetical protein
MIKETVMTINKSRDLYVRPVLVKHENLQEITFECPEWQCSVTVPPAPQQ